MLYSSRRLAYVLRRQLRRWMKTCAVTETHVINANTMSTTSATTSTNTALACVWAWIQEHQVLFWLVYQISLYQNCLYNEFHCEALVLEIENSNELSDPRTNWGVSASFFSLLRIIVSNFFSEQRAVNFFAARYNIFHSLSMVVADKRKKIIFFLSARYAFLFSRPKNTLVSKKERANKWVNDHRISSSMFSFKSS